MMTDVLILGAGPAGLTAAIYARRAGLTATVFDKGFAGGQTIITPEIENYPAIASISGPEFSQRLYEQAVSLGAAFKNEEVRRAQLSGTVKILSTEQGPYEGRTVILAGGVKRRELGCPGEAELAGKGVSYCATCDGAFFRGKQVVLVGGGNTALEDALFLSNLCEKVTLVHRRDRFRGEKQLSDAVLARDNVDVRYSSAVTRILGESHVEAAEITNLASGQTARIPAAGVFIAIGYEPDSALIAGQVTVDEAGYIVAGEDCHTNLSGVFAAGDGRQKPLRQIVTAASDGAVAAYQAANYINAQ